MGSLACFQDLAGSTVVEVMRGEQCDAEMSMLVGVPGKNVRQKVIAPALSSNCQGNRGVLQGLELRLGEGGVVTHMGTGERASCPEVGEQLCCALAGHWCSAVRLQGQGSGLDALLKAGILDEPWGQRRVLLFGDHSPDHISAEDVEQHVKVEVRVSVREAE